MKINKKLMTIAVATTLIASITATAFAAFTVSDSLIKSKWNANGGSSGFLGNPTTNTLTTPNGLGVYNHFDGGSIYRKKSFNEAYTVYGYNRDKWASLGWETGVLGFPTSDEADTYNKTGRFNHFEGGSIYYKHGASQSYEVHGDIRNLWSWFGWETSQLGFPKSDEYIPGKPAVSLSTSYYASRFDNGIMYHTYFAGSTGSPISFPAYSSTWPVMTAVKYGASTPFGTQKITSVSAYQASGGEFPSYGYTIKGSGFPANKKVKVNVSSIHYNLELGTVTTSSTGTFTFTGSDGGGHGGVPTYNGIATIWAQSESGPAAIYSYKPTNVKTVNYTSLR